MNARPWAMMDILRSRNFDTILWAWNGQATSATDMDACVHCMYKDPFLFDIRWSLMNGSQDPLTTPQRQQQRACYAFRAVAQNIEESPRRCSVAPRPETPTPQPGYIERTRTSRRSSNREAHSRPFG